MSPKTQYLIVAVILALVIVWIILRLVRKKKHPGSPCCGCGLSEACNKKPAECNAQISEKPKK